MFRIKHKLQAAVSRKLLIRHIGLQNWQLTDSSALVLKTWQVSLRWLRQLGLRQAFLFLSFTVIMPALIILNRWNRGETVSHSGRMRTMFTLREGSPTGICSRKAAALRRETRAVCENHLISNHWFAEYVRQFCTQNSERLLQAPADEKDGSKKIASSRDDAVSVKRCAEDWVVPLLWRNQSWRS